MRTLGSRRAVLSAGVAVLAAVAIAGCSAGQVAETAIKRPSSQGVNENNSNNTVGIRDLKVSYNGTTGYAAGDSAPLEVGIYNLTTQEVTVLVSSTPPGNSAASQTVVSGTMVQLIGGSSGSAAPSSSGEPSAEPSMGASAEPSAGASAPAAGGQPARLVLAPLGSATFLPGDQEQMQVVGLTKALPPGFAVNLTFEFSNGAQPLTLQAPVAPPLSPAPRGSGISDENKEIGG
jgi:hypothetical protein